MRLLEAALDEPLFSRTGGRLSLNHRGRALLDGLRQGWRAIERGAAAGAGRAFEGEYRVGTLGVLTNYVVLPVLLDLARERPAVVPVMRTQRATEANHRLLLGDLDVAFHNDAVPFPGVTLRRLGRLTNSIYCGRAHPLFRVRRIDPRRLLEHAFSVPSLGDHNTPMDNWPVELPRRVGLRIDLLWTNLEVCLSGRFVTVLPDVVAEPHLRGGALRRLASGLVPPTDVYGACRSGEEEEPILSELIAAVERRVADAASRPRVRHRRAIAVRDVGRES